MSIRKLAGTHTLPDNPTWIEFPRSDGDAAVLPTNTERVVDHEGHVNFMRPIGLAESTSNNWRIVIGGEIAKRMGLAEGPSYVLKSFPDGYQLYDHNKGPASSPRHDPYLCGSKNVNRFRSTNEFIPHGLWLMQDPTLNRANCACKYCAKKPQRIVTDTLELPSNRRASGTPSGTPSKPGRRLREGRVARENPYAAIRHAPKPVKQLTGPQQALVPERDSDIRALLVGSETKPARWYRKGELAWCALNPPIRGRTEGESIHFWPGLVHDVNIKSEAIPLAVDRTGDHSQHRVVGLTGLYEQDSDKEASSAPGQQREPYTPPPAEESVRVPWVVRQSNVYTMKLLAVAHDYVVSDHQLLPYLAHAPSDELLRCVSQVLMNFLHEVPVLQMDSDLNKIFPFNPVSTIVDQPWSPEAISARFMQAVAPYSLAIQIASNLAHYWAPTDEWECKFIVPSARQSPPPSTMQPESAPELSPSLHTLITQSMTNNANNVSARTSTQEHPPPPDGIHNPGLSGEELQALKLRMLGPPPQSARVSTTITQTRYQGLWWGAERIWTDDIVRLKLARYQFAPEGTDVISSPSGPSATTRARAKAVAQDIPDEMIMGASEKGLFMRLDGLFMVEVPKEDGSGISKQCRASGTLYELADEDWEGDMGAGNGAQPTGTAPQNGTTVGNGKGKERAHDIRGLDHASSTNLSISSDPNRINAVSSTPSISHASEGPPFMPGPSPLKPPPLPNPDPTIPAQEVANVSISSSASQPKQRGLGAQLSHPVLSTPYPLPTPPKGYKFRPIHPAGHEVVLSLTYISGRYYPRLFEHPLMVPVVEKAIHIPASEGGLYESRHLWAMEGFLPGVHQSMDPVSWKPGRTAMFKDADALARGHFLQIWEQCKQERGYGQDDVHMADQSQADHEVIDVDMS